MKNKVLVIGLGISGRAAVEFLLAKGYSVIGVDRDRALLCHERLQALGAQLLHESDVLSVEEFDFIVPSPGVPEKHPLYAQALQKGKEIIGEAQLAFKEMRQKAVAITGTNGKTTVALLTKHVLEENG